MRAQSKQSKIKQIFLLQCELLLKNVEVIENEKHGKDNIDNHPGQNYNVEHFCIGAHGTFL